MRIEFEATIDDFVAIHGDWFERRQKRVKLPMPKWLWAWLLLAFGLAGAYAVGRVAGVTTHSVILGSLHGMTAGCIGGAALLIPLSAIARLVGQPNERYLRILRESMESGAIPVETGTHVAEVHEDVLVYTDPLRVVQQPLGTLDAIEEHDDCIYLMRKDNPDYRIPKRAFASEAQVSEFKRRVEAHLWRPA